MEPMGRLMVALFLLVLTLGMLSGPTSPVRRAAGTVRPHPSVAVTAASPAPVEPVAEAAVPDSPPVPSAAPAPAPAPAPAVPPPPSNTPARLLIPTLSVSARIEHLGTGPDGAMETPYNLSNVGWFSPGVRPGDRGDAVIDGHVGLPGHPLVFAHLDRLRLGDEVTVVQNDGHSAHFIVSGSRVVAAGSRPSGLFASGGAPTLSLITCTGPYDGGNYSYADRLIVDARYAGTD